MSDRTPTPWRCAADGLGSYGIIANQGPVVVQPAKAFSEADAAFIVRAVNSHDGLVKALEMFVERVERHGNWDDGCFYYGATSASELQDPLSLARAALAKAKGEA